MEIALHGLPTIKKGFRFPWVLHLIKKTNVIHFSWLTWLHHHYKYFTERIIIIFNNYWFHNCFHWVQMEICLYQQWIHNLSVIFCHNLKGKWIAHEIPYNFHIFEMKIKHDCQHCRNPNLAKCGGEAQHLEKLGIWSSPRLPNVQSSTARPKTPRIGVFLVSLESSWSVDIENGLASAIWTSVAQVMGKRRAGSQFDSRPLKVGNRLAPDVRFGSAIRR